MEQNTIWTTAVAASLAAAVAAVAAVAGSAARSSHEMQQQELAISQYIDCLNKYAAAKAAGKFPEGIPIPSGSEVCGNRR